MKVGIQLILQIYSKWVMFKTNVEIVVTNIGKYDICCSCVVEKTRKPLHFCKGFLHFALAKAFGVQTNRLYIFQVIFQSFQDIALDY